MTTKELLQQETSNEPVRKLEKHPFNIFPEMTSEEREEVRSDIQMHGYDERYPVILYQEKVLDGWNRQQICEELCVPPTYEDFKGNDLEAMDFIWRSNKRRNLTSSQWSAIATEAQPIMESIEAAVKKEKAEKFEGNKNAAKEKQLVEQIPPTEIPKRDDSKRSAVMLAKQFNTNPKYVAKAKELKTCNPEIFKQVKNGEITINDVIRAEKTEALVTQKKNMESEDVQKGASNISAGTTTDVHESPPVTHIIGKIDLVLEISEDLLVKLKAYAKAQNIENKLFEWDTDYKQAAVDLLTIGVEHPTFEYDTDAMKVFKDEIQRLNEEYRFPESLKEGQNKDKNQGLAIKTDIQNTNLDSEGIKLVKAEPEETK
jgi:hypothetical protein